MRRPAAALTLTTLLATPAFAALDLEQTSAVDAVFADVDSIALPGCAVGVFRRGKIEYARGYGMASLEHGLPITPNTVFYAGSVSKQFVAAAVARAANEGHLELDDDIRAWFPELPDYGAVITVRHLVHHTSGLRDYLTLMALSGVPFETPVSERWVLDLIARQHALNFEPGSEYLYSNSGYFLLAQLIQRATGMSLRDYSDGRFFEPLAMSSTRFHDAREQVVSRRALAYSLEEGTPTVNWTPSFDQVGSGGLLSTIEDLAAWDKSFYDASLGEGFWDTLTTPGRLASGDALDYGFGLRIDTFAGQARISHGGAMFGYRAHLTRFPDAELSFALLCNFASADTGKRVDALAEALIGPDTTEQEETPPTSEESAEAEQAALADPAWQAGWAGTFRCAELAASAIIDEEQGVLRYRIGFADPVALLPISDDGAVLDSAREVSLEGVRNGQGTVDSFVIDAGRVRGLEFRRVDR